jgi:hypothetical protein
VHVTLTPDPFPSWAAALTFWITLLLPFALWFLFCAVAGAYYWFVDEVLDHTDHVDHD